MAAPLSLNRYRHSTVYADDVHHGMYRSYHEHIYTQVIDQFPNDPVGFRRLVHRDFTNVRGIPTCVEHTVCRVANNGLLSDWSFDVIVFRTHTVPPVRWNENNIPPPFHVDENVAYDPVTQGSSLLFLEAQNNDREENANMERMNRAQDILSRLP